ncbi:hypothetical protein ACFQW6_03615 [Nocardioides sp. GCM10028917]|uniref:hypothetical protein n=1 Tax=Nocardioides sp. GCM10028917 TaxID=3273408 RepID=UPI00361E96DC
MDNDALRLRSHRFFPDERVTAEVLNASADAERERRWLHNKLLHGYGISFGLEVERGDRDTSVLIGRGHAIDLDGRDLVVDQAQSVQVPPVPSGEFDLVCEWSDDTRETSTSSCGASGETVRREIPRLKFVLPGSSGAAVVLATITVSGCKLSALVFDARRPLVSTPVPYVDGGRFFPRPGDWSVLTLQGKAVGLRIEIPTVSANFFGTVSYSARVMGNRWKGQGQTPAWKHVLCLDEYVIRSGPKSFELGVVILADDMTSPPFTPVSLESFAVNESVGVAAIPDTLGWTVAWMGVEGTQ